MTAPPVVDLDTALGWCGRSAGGPASSALDRDLAGRAADRSPVFERDNDGGPAGVLDHLIGMLDLTSLEGADTPATVAELCRRGVAPDPADPSAPPVATICVYPSLVATAVEHTAGSPVGVASVAGAFPSGLSPLPVRLADIEAAVVAGADEIDLVLNRSAFLSHDHATVHGDLVASIEAAAGRRVKVILEVGELGSPHDIYTAAILAMAAGADFVKTSTGKISRSATPEAVSYLVDAAARFLAETGRPVGIKVSGGVRTVSQAIGYHALVVDALGDDWSRPELFRFGASGLLDALVAARRAAG
jgi:deoxyribose-phosphate aldolase